MDLRSDDGLIATQLRGPPGGRRPQPDLRVSRYDINRVEIYHSARKHNVDDADIVHAVERAVAIGERDDGAVLYLGPDRAGNLLEVVAVLETMAARS